MFDQENYFTIDNTTPFAKSQDITAEAISDNVIDLTDTGVDFMNPARAVYIIARVTTAFLTCVSLEIKLINDSTVNLATSEKEIAMWRFLLADINAAGIAANGGLIINQALPIGTMEYQYLGLQFTPFTDATAGAIFCALSDSPERPQSHIELVQAGT